MNQNRNNNNNRRRGRGNNRSGPGGAGGGNQGNRIDSRARGNAPQMLEKYRKMAHDASLNGDRVQTEYYLQFADHYFRVVADSRTQRDDQRPRREDGQNAPDDDYEEEDEMAELGRPNTYQSRREREDEQQNESAAAQEAERTDESSDQPNPFVRDERERRPRQRNRNGTANGNVVNSGEADGEPSGGFDPGLLPPSIARDPEVGDESEDAPRPRTRTRRPRRSAEGDETIEAVG